MILNVKWLQNREFLLVLIGLLLTISFPLVEAADLLDYNLSDYLIEPIPDEDIAVITTDKLVYYVGEDADAILAYGVIPADIPICSSITNCNGYGPSIGIFDPNGNQVITLVHAPAPYDGALKIDGRNFWSSINRFGPITTTGMWTLKLYYGGQQSENLLDSTTFLICNSQNECPNANSNSTQSTDPPTNSTTTSPPVNGTTTNPLTKGTITNNLVGERKSNNSVGIQDQIRVYNGNITSPPTTNCTIDLSTPNDIIFKDDYSSNAGWIETGKAYVNNINFPGVAKLDHINGLGSYTNDNHRVIKHLSIVLPSEWNLKTEYMLQEDNIGTSIVVALSPSTDVIDPFDNYKSIGIYEDHESTALLFGQGKIPITLNTKYYLLLEKTPNQIRLSAYSDPQRTIQIPNSSITLNANFTYDNLMYIQHGILAQAGPARITTSEIDNTEIFIDMYQNQDPSCPVSIGNNTSTTNSTTTNLPTNSTTNNPPPISTPEPSSTYVILVASKSSVPGCQQNNECYFPSEIRVKIGDKIKWFNSDSVAHTITSGDPSDGPDGEFGNSLWVTADTYSHEFIVEGQFDYYCTIHPWMTGTILVGDVDYEPRIPWDGVSELDNNSANVTEPVPTPELILEYDYSQPPITVFTDRISYSEGNSIKISGEVRDRLRGFPVILEVISANNTRTTLEEVEVDKYQKYSITLNNTEGPTWQSSGTYTAKVLYGTEFRTAETSFQFTSYYVPIEPKQEVQATMNIDINNDKVLVYGKVNLNATILENGPSIQYIESEGTEGVISSLSDTFEWNGTDYKTFFWISNFTNISDDILFKLWSGNGTKGKVLVYDIASIVANNTVSISNSTQSVVTENYTSITRSSSDSCTYCYIKPVTTNSTTSIDTNTNLIENEINQELILPATTDTGIISKDNIEPIDASNSEVGIPSQITTPYNEPELEQFQLLKQDNQTEQSIVLWSDKSIYEDGEKIRIEGIIPQTMKKSNISIQVYSPSNFNIVNERLPVSDIGMFKIEFDTLDYLWFENGEYIIKLTISDDETSELILKVIEPVVDNTLTQSNSTVIQVNSTNDDNKSIELIVNNSTSQEETSVSNESLVYINQVLETIQDFIGSIFV